MRKSYFYSILLVSLSIIGCKDDDIVEKEVLGTTIESGGKEMKNVGNRLIFTSSDDVKNVIDQMKDGMPSTVARSSASVSVSGNGEFQSLSEAKELEFLSSLTKTQLDSIKNDEDMLEFCAEDSIIADPQFAQLVNESREIQVGTTVYKYLDNGVAITDEATVDELKDIEKFTADIKFNFDGENAEIQVTPNVKFIPMPYGQEEAKEEIVSRSYVSRENLTLGNNVTIPVGSIRDVNYNDKGDGNWFHRLVNGFFGRNIVAIIHFEKKRKLTMNFYDQNYIIYANIGTKLKFQKRVCGIWWNVKAQEMRQGWTAIELEYTLPKPVGPSIPSNPFATSASGSVPTSNVLYNRFPFQDEQTVLMHIPLVSYDLTGKDINNAFRAGLNSAVKQGTSWLKNTFNNTPKNRVGIYTYSGNTLYTVIGANERCSTNTKSMETKFYSKWFPGTYQFAFSLGSKVSFKGAKFDAGKTTRLRR